MTATGSRSGSRRIGPGGEPRVVFGFTITGGKIVGIEILADPERLAQLDLVVLDD